MSHPASARRLSRRGLLAAAGGVGLAALLAGCGSEDTDAPSANTNSGPWSFTDDRGEKLSADAPPTRVVAFTGVAAALVDFGVNEQVVGVFGETTRADGSKDPQAGELNVESVEILGNTWGEFNLEKYTGLRPDLLVTHMYDSDALWYVPDESKDKILSLAPVAAVTTARVPMTQPIERYAQLAESLGADLSAPAVTKAKARFDAAAESVRAAVKANPGIKVMACSGSPDLFYVSNPQVGTDLMYFAELGVDLVVPTKLEAGDYFEALSWENAGKFPADLLLLDNRGSALQAADLAAKPTWAQLPAVAANQVTTWDSVPRFSYAGAAPLLENLATAIKGAKKVS